MRKSFDGLMAIIRDTYQLDPYANAVYLFCGRDNRKIKALYFDKTGFVLMQKRLDGTGRFQWPRNASEARLLSRQEFRWLMEGLSIDQPKAIRAGGRKKDFSNFYFRFRPKTIGTYPPSAFYGFYICGCSRSRYGSDFLSVDNFPEKKQSGMPFTAFCLFSGKLSPVIMTKRKSGWFAAIFLFLYNKDKKEKDG